MSALHDVQTAMATAIRHGPDYIPEAMFAGDAHRVLMGFIIHANTISHGRLVALEDSFPRLREAIGEALFNTLSRNFVEQGGGSGEVLAQIGRDFPEWLEERGEQDAALFAQYDRAWLQAFHASNALPLALSDIASFSEAKLLSFGVVPHPAAWLCEANTKLCSLLELEQSPHILVVRPDEAVGHKTVDAAAAQFFYAAKDGATIGALFEALSGQHPPEIILSAATSLIGAGALCEKDSEIC